jgi:hypothetical protein
MPIVTISIALGAHFSRKIRQPSEDVYESTAAARRALDDDPHRQLTINLAMK